MPVDYIPEPIRAVPHLVTGARAFNVIYQNLQSRPILVIVTMNGFYAAVGSTCSMAARLDPTTPPATYVGTAGMDSWAGGEVAPRWDMYSLTFVVPAGNYYAVDSFVAGVGTWIGLTSWVEVDL